MADLATRRRPVWPALAVDVVAVMVFVAVGRDAHHHGLSVAGLASTAWPFLAGLAVGWALLVARGRPTVAVTAGVAPWLATVVVGMVLRVVAGQGTAVSFVAVALAFLGLFLLGWRALVAVAGRRA